MSTHKITHRSTIPFPCWLLSLVISGAPKEWCFYAENPGGLALSFATHYSTNPPDQRPLGEPAPEGSLPVTTPAAPSLQSVAEGAAAQAVESTWCYLKGGSAGTSEEATWFRNNKDLGGPAHCIRQAATIITSHFAPVYAAIASENKELADANASLADLINEFRFDSEGDTHRTPSEVLLKLKALLTERDERIGRLNGEVVRLLELVQQQSKTLGVVKDSECALRTRCEELQRDKERLDWMEKQYHPRLYRNPPGSWGFIAGDGTVIVTGTGPTLRDAIDAARKEGQQAHEKGEGL